MTSPLTIAPSRRVLPSTSIVLFAAVVMSGAACAKRSHNQTTISAPQLVSASTSPRININTASAEQLETLPGIGKALAARIVEHREKFGPFRRAEHLIIVRGISDRRFRALQELITVE